MRLTPHFTLEEATLSRVAAVKNITNLPDADTIENIRYTASAAEEVRMLLGNEPMIITSWYRCPKLNAAVGGVRNSAHLHGLAIDFICPHFGSPAEIVKAIAASSIDFDQCIVEFGRWVHFAVAQAGEKGRRSVFRID